MMKVPGRVQFAIGVACVITRWFCCALFICFCYWAQRVDASAADIPVAKVLPEVLHIPVSAGDDIRFRRLSLSQGLSQTRVAQIIQDDEGYLWFGTQHGLNRFDGQAYRVFKNEPGQSGSLSGTFIYALFKDKAGTVWVGSDQGLDAFERQSETFRHYPLDEPNPVVIHISQDPDGTLWLATSVGLYNLDPTTGKFGRFQHDAADPTSLASSDIKSTGFDRQGVLWVANGQGLDAFDLATKKVTARIPLREAVREFYFHEDRFGVFWIIHGSGSGLATYDRKKNELTRYSFYADKRTETNLTGVYAILEARDGTIWLGTMGAGLLKFDRANRRFTAYQANRDSPDGISENRVIALLEDTEGNIWTGLHATPPNFFPVKAPPFEELKPDVPFSNAFGESLVNSVFLDSRNRVWLAGGGALTVVDLKTRQRQLINPMPDRSPVEVLSITEAPDGTMWIGTLGTGLFHMDAQGNVIENFRHDPSESSSLSSDIVTRLHFDGTGNLWATTWNGLVRRDLQSGKFVTYKSNPSASAEAYFSITEQKNGLFWLGGTNGLHSFDPANGTFAHYTHSSENPVGLSNNTINTVHVDEDGRVWVGTQNGLNRLDTSTGVFKKYFERDGLAGGAISCILESRDHKLWMSTNNGVSRFDKQTSEVSNFTEADGLPGNDLTGWNACYARDDGRMLFGGFSGAALLRPEPVVAGHHASRVVFTELRIEDRIVRPGDGSALPKAIGYAEHLRLAAKENNFSISFSPLSFADPESHRYRYRLQGLDDIWHDVGGGLRSVSFYSLPHGVYRLEVQASTGRGPWLDPPAGISIEILPPWWDSWWFRAIYMCAAAILLVALYRFRLRRLAVQYNIRFDERVGERTRIARELHDSLLQGLHGLMFSLQAVRDLLPQQPDKAANLLDKALERGDEALIEGRNAVEDLRGTGLGESDIVTSLAALTDDLKRLAAPRPPSFDVFVEGAPREIRPLVRDEIYRIAREALRNAFMHSQGSKVECEVEFGDRTFQLRVRDDGKGLERSVLEAGVRPGHWGLPGMRERAESVGGRFELWSAGGKGTEVKLAIPAANVYENR